MSLSVEVLHPVVQEEQTLWEIFLEEIVLLKWRVLFLCLFVSFGSYYIYDFPGAIGTGHRHTIQSKFWDLGKDYTQEMNQALYSVYSWPNTVLAIFGGLLIDKYLGLRKAMMLFALLVFSGSFIFWIGVMATNYPVMIVARVIFGLGGESLSVAQSAFVARWFKQGRGLAFAFALTVSFARIGSSFNFLFSPELAVDYGINVAVFGGMIACGISMLSCITLLWIDIYGQRKGIVPAETFKNATPFSFKELRSMPLMMWIICGITISCYGAIFPFVGIAKNFFEVKYNITGETASKYISVYQFASAGGSPVVGYLVDYLGRFSYFIFASGASFIVIHIILLAAKFPPWLMMGLMGVCYSVLVSSLWPAVPYVVPEAMVGSAYGWMTAIQNFGLAVIPLVAGAILDMYTPSPSAPFNTTNVTNHSLFSGFLSPYWNKESEELYLQSYLYSNDQSLGSNHSSNSSGNPTAPLPTLPGFQYTELLFIGISAIATILAILFWVMDVKRNHGMLTASPDRRQEIKEEREPLMHVNDSIENTENDDKKNVVF